jgi:predicted acetyltransferase
MEFETGGTSKSILSGESRPPLGDSVRLVTGHVADHRLVYDLLRMTRAAPSAESFASSLEEPSYEPTDRLLVRRGSQIVAHVQLLHRAAWFQGVRLPVAGIECLAALPELDEAGYDRLLLTSAEQSLRGTAAMAAFALTDRAGLFRSSGWREVGALQPIEANAHDVLARLSACAIPQQAFGQREAPLRIRHWRHVELEPLLAVARQATAITWGGIDRSEPYWRWLVGRKRHDALSVAIEGRDDWDSLAAPPHIVGYSIMRGQQIIELSADADYPQAAHLLLARACQDAVERDHRAVSLHIPPSDPLHELLLAAGGQRSARPRNARAWFAKLLDPVRWIEGMYPVLLERAKAAGIARPFAIGFDTGRCRYRLELTRRSGHFIVDAAAPSDVTCSPATMGALFMGNLDLADARQADGIFFRDEEIAAQIAALFPKVSFWQSAFDAVLST